MSHHEYAIANLAAVERKHKQYFASANRSIMDYVKIKGLNYVTIQMTNNALPPDIKHEIESMFWVD